MGGRHHRPVPSPDRLDAVLHFASPASPVDYLRLPIETMKVGSVGTLNALELARVNGARFLLASTSETYGDPQVHPQPETYWGHVNPVGPRAVYDEAKRFAEALATAYRTYHRTDVAIVRIFNTYGPRMRPDDGRAIPTFISQALLSDPITVAGDGRQTRSVCYVDDLVDGIVRLLTSSEDGPINIGNPHELSMLELASLVRDRRVSTPRSSSWPVLRTTRWCADRTSRWREKCWAGRQRSACSKVSSARSAGSKRTLRGSTVPVWP